MVDMPQHKARRATNAQVILAGGAVLGLGWVLWSLTGWIADLWLYDATAGALLRVAVYAIILSIPLTVAAVAVVMVYRLSLTTIPGGTPVAPRQLLRIDPNIALAEWRMVQRADAGNPTRGVTTYQVQNPKPKDQPPEQLPLADLVPLIPPGNAPTGSELEQLLLTGDLSRSGLRLLVGHDKDGQPHYLDLETSHMIAIMGASRSGKSATTRFLLAQLAMMPGADSVGIVLCDPHGGAHPDSLQVSCAALRPAYLLEPAIDRDEIAKTIAMVGAIAARRLSQPPPYAPLVLVIDEFTSLMLGGGEYATKLENALIGITDQYAKVGVRVLLLGQKWNAHLTGGTALRHGIQSVITHAIKAEQARFLLDMDSAALAEKLQPRTGNVLFQAHWADDPIHVRVPYVAPRDLLTELVQARIRPAPSIPAGAAVPPVDPKQAALDKLRAEIGGRDRAFRLAKAKQLARAGMTAQDIQYACRIADTEAGSAWRAAHATNGTHA
jgi:hypothetical protein